ncbi:MAG: YpdA family putative bacillithiol disulfide reductase [bacterium]
MLVDNKVNDVVIIGAGPAGLACAIDAKKNNLDYLVLEKGCLVNSIFNFPTHLILFSTPDLLEIGGIPFIVATEKPTRSDLLKYYRIVSEHYDLNIHLFERVESVSGQKGGFTLTTSKGRAYQTKNLAIATGQYDTPNMMGVPGEDLDKVSHYYTEPHPYYRKKVAVIGGKNSAVEAALDLYKNGAEVTLIHRRETFGSSVKYWILPDIENRIRAGKIRALFNTVVMEIRDESIVVLRKDGTTQELENDLVLAMTGYNPDTRFLTQIGIELRSEYTAVHDPNTLETNVPGVYIAGVITAGSDGSKVFIENSRNHGAKIIGNILNDKNGKR